MMVKLLIVPNASVSIVEIEGDAVRVTSIAETVHLAELSAVTTFQDK